MQAMAQQMGYHLTPAQAAQAAKQVKDDQAALFGPEGPQSWEEVVEKIEAKVGSAAYEKAKREILGELAPLFSEVQQTKKASIEKQLSQIDPTWAQYEDAMIETLQRHPTLAQDPSMLYRMSVPSDVWEARATQAALRKLEAKGQPSTPGSSSTTKQPVVSKQPKTLREAFALAKQAVDPVTGELRPGYEHLASSR
jgi:hypothetical protein